MENDGETAEKWRETFSQLMKQLPDGYVTKRDAIIEMRKVFHEELAASLAPDCNKFASEARHDSADLKLKLAAGLNRDLRLCGLQVRCPKTGLPGTLLGGTVSSRKEDEGAFSIATPQGRSGAYKRSFTAQQLPYLELVRLPDVVEKDHIGKRGRSAGGDPQRGR
jgi:hypothetical protein